MAPYTRASTSRSIALRMKALQMKRACKTVPITAAVQNANTRKQAAISPKKSPKKLETKIGEGKSNLADSATPKKPESKCKGKKAKLKKSVTVKSKASKSNSKSKKQSKSSKSMPSDEDEEDEDATGGLKLLKRGMVTMNRITRGLIRKKRRKVQFNAKGVPVGQAAIEMQSYIGVLARTKVPISVKDWREVDEEAKQKIWEQVTVTKLPY